MHWFEHDIMKVLLLSYFCNRMLTCNYSRVLLEGIHVRVFTVRVYSVHLQKLTSTIWSLQNCTSTIWKIGLEINGNVFPCVYEYVDSKILRGSRGIRRANITIEEVYVYAGRILPLRKSRYRANITIEEVEVYAGRILPLISVFYEYFIYPYTSIIHGVRCL